MSNTVNTEAETLNEEQVRLWDGLEHERVSRIAGDDANNALSLQIQDDLSDTEGRLSTEVIHREQGDLNNIGTLNTLSQALSDYRIKTDQEINAEKIARQQLGVNLNATVNSATASFDHREIKLYQTINDLKAEYYDDHAQLDDRISKYEDMLQDITTDSIQITMDNGDIRMGAWTILSQAREWDLEILGKVKGYQDKTVEDLDQALKDIQNQLPVEEDLINKLIESLSETSVIKNLSDKLNSAITSQDELEYAQVQEAAKRAEEMVKLAAQQAEALALEKQDLVNRLNQEAEERIDAIAREGEVRLNLIEELENGFTEKFELIEEEQSTTLNAFNNYKASTDESLANFNTSINLISGDLSSQGEIVSALDLRLKDAEETAASAVTKSEAALTATSSQAEIIDGIKTSLADKADASALNTLGSEIEDLDGRLSVTTTSLTQLQGSLDDVNNELSNKASLTALNSLSGTVETIGNQTTVNTDAVTNLKNKIDVVEGALAIKLDASVISNYYTKGQADDKAAEIAAGKIETYDANLVIGGANLLKNSNFEGELGASNWYVDGGSWIKQQDAVHGTVMKCIYGSISHDWLKLEQGSTFVFSAMVKSPVDRSIHFEVPLHFWAGKDYTNQGKYEGLKKSHDVIPAGVWTKIWVVIKLTGDANTVKPIIYDVQPLDGLEIAWTKLEKGTKVTDWTPNDQEIQQSINANANAIQTTNAEVARVNGEVVATATSVSNLSSNVGLLQGSINEVRQTVTNNQESTNTLVTSLKSGMADADDLSMMMRNATVVFEDLTFKNGFNEVSLYNNYANGALVTNFTDKLPDNPVASTRQLQFIHSGGATTPGLGGFHQQVQSRANGVFLIKFVAKLPVGFSFDLAANAYGDGANGYYIGSSEGTGKFKTYYAVYRCGATGNFSTVGFVYVNGPQPTPENPLIWYLASSTVYDCLDSKVAPDSVLNGIAEAKSTASTAVNKAEATALVAQNLQASLDNTNAKLSTDYYTKSSTDDAISKQITDLSATLDMSVLPSKRDTTKPNQWLLTHVVPKDAGWASSGAGVKPDFSVLKTGIKNKRIYCADGNTTFSGSEYDNTVLYFRTIVYVNADVEVNLGNFTGDDAHSIYVNGVLNFNRGYYGSTANVRLALKTGLNTIDVICYNGGGDAGFFSSVLLSSLVVNMYAPESVEEQAAATANAVSSLTTTVSALDGVVTSQARQIVTLESSKSAIENGGIAGNDEFVIDLTDPAYNRDLYYPVLLGSFSTTARQTIRVWATLDGISVPSWASHGGGFSLNAQFQTGGAGWGTIDPEIVTDNFSYSWTHYGISPLDEIGHISASSQPFFYVRGGGRYTLSKPVSKTVQVCAPNSSLSGYFEGTLYPRPYQESSVPKSINQGVYQQNVKLRQTNEVLDGVKAVSTVTVDNNGVMSGYGLISELANGQVRSSFGVNADTFFIGAPAGGKKPFIVTSYPQTINGVSYPAGTWIDVALIAEATIGTAHIADASITNAKIASLDASKITAGVISADRISANSITADKLMIGDSTNLWGNQHFDPKGPLLGGARAQLLTGIPQLKGNGMQIWGRDHIAPYTTKIPIKEGDTIVIEYVAGRNAGPDIPLYTGLWTYNASGSTGNSPWQYGSVEVIADLGWGWHRYRRIFKVSNAGHSGAVTYGVLFFIIEQAEYSSDPAYWTVGDVTVRKALGGELIVNGAITADKLSVNSLSAISANLGTLVTYKDPAYPNKARMVITGSLITVYDDNNKVRVKLGLW